MDRLQLDSLEMPVIHLQDCKILSDTVQVEFVVDNQLIADVCNGLAEPKQTNFTTGCDEIVRQIENVLLAGWIPRMCVLPLVTWRKRSYTSLADALANAAMDRKQTS